MANEKKALVGKTITLAKMPASQFDANLRSIPADMRTNSLIDPKKIASGLNRMSPDAKSDKLKGLGMASLPIKVWNGQTREGENGGLDTYGNNTVDVTVDLLRHSNYFMGKGVPGAPSAPIGGATPSQMPISIELIENESRLLNDPDRNIVGVTIDPMALANANYQSKTANAKDGYVPDPKSKDRLDATMRCPVANGGITGMSTLGAANALIETVKQHYIFNTSKNSPEKNKPTPENIAAAARLLTDNYNDFMTKVLDGDDNAKKALMTDLTSNKTGAEIKGSALDETTIDTLKKAFKVMDVSDEATGVVTKSIVAKDGLTDKSAVNKALVKVGERFNREFSQTVNARMSDETYKQNAEVRSILGRVDMRPYCVDVKDNDGVSTGMTAIQPNMVGKFQPYASSIAKANAVAQLHGNAEAQADLKEQGGLNVLYDSAIVEGVKDIENSKSAVYVSLGIEDKTATAVLGRDRATAVENNIQNFNKLKQAVSQIDADNKDKTAENEGMQGGSNA